MLALRLKGTHPINRMRDEMECLFDQAFAGFPSLAPLARLAPASPAVNVWEDADNFYVEADLPGLKIDDVELTFTGDLTDGFRRLPDERKGPPDPDAVQVSGGRGAEMRMELPGQRGTMDLKLQRHHPDSERGVGVTFPDHRHAGLQTFFRRIGQFRRDFVSRGRRGHELIRGEAVFVI